LVGLVAVRRLICGFKRFERIRIERRIDQNYRNAAWCRHACEAAAAPLSTSGRKGSRAQIQELLDQTCLLGKLVLVCNTTLDLTLLLSSDNFCTLENVSFMRHAADKLSMVFRVKAMIKHFVKHVSSRTAIWIDCILDTGVASVEKHHCWIQVAVRA
jgi:hypothetical protein